MVQDEPRHHQVFHQGAVRILDVQIPPGEVTLFHTHDTAILYVPISVSPTDTQILGQEWLGVKPTDRSRFEGRVVASDTSYAIKPLTHRVKNVGDRLFRLIAITNGSAGNNEPRGAPPGTAVLSSPWYAAAKLEVGAGTTSEWRTAAMPTVVVSPAGGRLIVEGPEGTRKSLDAPGSWAYVSREGRYRIANQDQASVAVVIVEANQP
jgi:hypothetical protein